MATLTKAEMVENLSQELGLNKRESKHMVEAFFEKVRESLESGHSVRLSGFGNFILRDKAERPGRNPKTLEPITVSARRVVTFNAGQKLKEQIAEVASQEVKDKEGDDGETAV